MSNKAYTLEKISDIVRHKIEKDKATLTSGEFLQQYDNENIDELQKDLMQYFKKLLGYINRFKINKIYNIDNETIEELVTNVSLYGYDIDFQQRLFVLKNIDGLGAIYLDDELIASYAKKISPLEITGDFCWGYKGGSSTTRTAYIILNAVLYKYDENNTYYNNMAFAFANDILSIFTYDMEATLEEEKVLEWISNYERQFINIGSNIVKTTCKELGITQKELAKRLDVSPASVSDWAKGNIPKMAKMYLELLLETKDLKEKFEILKKAQKILSD